MNSAVQKLASVTKDIAPVTTSRNICLIWLWNKHSAFHFLSLTTLLFLRSPYVATQVIYFQHVLSVCKIFKVGLYYAFAKQAFQIFNIRK